LSQTATNVQVLVHLIDCGFEVQQAVEFPRWCNTRSGDFLIENSFPRILRSRYRGSGIMRNAATTAILTVRQRS